MFICKKCFSNYQLGNVPDWMYPKSFGPCEICGALSVCIDHHGELILKEKINDHSKIETDIN
jgi:hypothetical protein